VLTRDAWREIVRFKPRAFAGHEGEVRDCVRELHVIRESAKDPEVHLYCRSTQAGCVCTVVGGKSPESRFVITAYFTKQLKKRHDLWKKVRVYRDRIGSKLTVWFDDPKKEAVYEEASDNVILMKDKRGRVIGFGRLNYLTRKQQEVGVNVPGELQVI
jgi:hypothetical protein